MEVLLYMHYNNIQPHCNVGSIEVYLCLLSFNLRSQLLVLFFCPPQLISQGFVVSLQDANNANNGNGLMITTHHCLPPNSHKYLSVTQGLPET